MISVKVSKGTNREVIGQAFVGAGSFEGHFISYWKLLG